MPELGALFAAVAALLIVWAWPGWTVRILQALKAHSPGLFGPLFDALIGADSAIYNTLRGWADNATQPFTALVDRAIAGVDSLTQNPLAFARAVYALLVRLYSVSIPDAIAAAVSQAAALFAQAEQAAETRLQAAEQSLASLAAQLTGLGQRLEEGLQGVVASTLQLAHQALAYADARFVQAEQDAVQFVGQEAARATEAEREIVAEAESEVARVEAQAQSWANEVRLEVGNIAQGLEGEVARARAELGAEIVNFEDLVKARVQAVIDSSPLALATVLGEAGERALAADVETLVTLAAAEIRKQIKDADALRARYAPQIQKAASGLGKP